MGLRIPLTEVRELERFPLEERKTIVEDFNKSPETVTLQKRLGALPFRFAAVLMIIVLGVMVLVYDLGAWSCMAAGLACFLVGVPLGMVLQVVLLRRSLRTYVQRRIFSRT